MKKSNISDRVLEYVLHCPADEFRELTVSRLAAAFKVNRCYLARKFKGDKDFTLCEFLIREKLFRSVEILKNDAEISIKELSAIMGFSNSNYFIRIFKERYGTSPGNYRNCMKPNLQSLR